MPDWVPPKQDCAVTFRNDGDIDIIVEPRNDYGNFEKAILVPSGRSATANFYPADYIITLYAMGYEKDFFPHFQRWGERATSARITIGFDEETNKFIWDVTAILRGRAPLFPPEELDSHAVSRSDDEDDDSADFDEDDEDEDSDDDSEDSYDARYDLLDIVFVVDATAGHGNFIPSTVHTIKSALHNLGRPFRKGNFRAALIVTRDYMEGGSEFESVAFTSDLNEFEHELDSITPEGGKDGFCAFNAGMKEALSSDMDWNPDAKKVIIIATAGVPHSIGEKQDLDEVDGYTVSTQDPIRMARRMNLLGINLAFLTDVNLIHSEDSRILCFLRALSRMVSGAGVYSSKDPTVILNYVAPAMPDGWANGNTVRVDELRPSDAVQRSGSYRSLNKIYSEAHTLTSSDVREALDIDDPYAAPMAGRITFAKVKFINSGRLQISLECRDGNGKLAVKRSLKQGNAAIAKVETHSVFSYILRTVKKKRDYKDKTTRDMSIDVSSKI